MIYHICVFISSLSFLAYVISYFASPFMKSEFKRLGLENIGFVAIALELLGSIGLLAGLTCKPILLFSSAGLALLMLIAVLFRIRHKDGIWLSLPAIFYMLLNLYIFVETM